MSTTYASPATASNTLQDSLALAGRILFAILFVPAGIGKITGFAGTVGYISSAGLPLPALGAVAAIIAEVGFGLLLLVGFKTRWAALVLAFFTVAAAFSFHNYWALPAEAAYVNQLMFFKNMAITGGLLAFAAFGAGAWSVDGKRG